MTQLNSPPRVSIGIPVYNGSQFLPDALEALLAQTFTDFEILISDNASTDDTEAISRRYAAQDQRIRYERLAINEGAVNNFNRLVALSQGEYFKWAAADDVCLPQFLETLVTVLDQRPDIAWCHCCTVKIDGAGRRLDANDPASEGLADTTQAGMPRMDHAAESPAQRFRGVLLGTSWCADSYGLFRREILTQTALFPQCYGAEKVMLGEMALRGKYFEVPKILFLQRVHGQASGNFETSQKQRKYVLGNKRVGWASFDRLRLLIAHCRSVRRTPLTWQQRVWSYLYIMQYVCQFRKWRYTISTLLTGRSMKGARVGKAEVQSKEHQTLPQSENR